MAKLASGRRRTHIRVNLTEEESRILWHAYVLRCHLGIQWPEFTHYEKIRLILNRYFMSNGIHKQDWIITKILHKIKQNSKTKLKAETKIFFKDIFKRGNGSFPLVIPAELKESETLDTNMINKLRSEVGRIRAISNNGGENMAQNNTAASNKGRSVIIPENVEISSLTLDNFREVTGKRFRMTKTQKARVNAGEITRYQAFEESKASGFVK